MNFLRALRDRFFLDMGKRRITRIIICAGVIAWIWTFADWLSGSLSFNLVHDLICLGLGIIAERCISWGKAVSPQEFALKQQNKQLLDAVIESTELLNQISRGAIDRTIK